ncbi:MarR family transcriptional regulator [Salmonella enterica]|nr:MarR family transcriptional regulator [Salmonella enterica]
MMTEDDTRLLFSHSSPMESPGFRFWQTFLQWQRQIDIALAPYNLTQQSFSILAVIGWLSKQNYQTTQNDAVRQKMIVEKSGVQKMQISLLLRKLEQGQLITVQPFLLDRRERLITLTPQGFRTLKEALPLVEKEDKRFLTRVHIDD